MTSLPYIPETVTVHLGPPDAAAENVTVSFPDYIKNVASSEIYPTWPENAIRANVYAQLSYALNRIYTEYYRSRGYAALSCVAVHRKQPHNHRGQGHLNLRKPYVFI
jgi:hypothetical protein